MLFDERARPSELVAVAEETGAVQMDVGEVERHRSALGDELGFIEKTPRFVRLTRQRGGVQGGGEEGFREMIENVGLAQFGESGGDLWCEAGDVCRWRDGDQCPIEPCPRQGEMVEGYVEEAELVGNRPLESLFSS